MLSEADDRFLEECCFLNATMAAVGLSKIPTEVDLAVGLGGLAGADDALRSPPSRFLKSDSQ